MSSFNLKYKPFGRNKLLIEWPNRIDEEILYDILAFKKLLLLKLENICDIQHAYQSIAITFKEPSLDLEKTITEIRSVYSLNQNNLQREAFLWKIPVCYDPILAFDQEAFCHSKEISDQEFITLHTGSIYTIYFTGFLPGFPYLGGLDKKLFMPRKIKPQRSVPKGAVAIGGEQTGIYPMESPGGWHVIGRTPIELFEIKNTVPTFLKAGDKVQFVPISLDTFHEIAQKIGNKNDAITKEKWYG